MMSWDFGGKGFREWLLLGEKPKAGWNMVGVWGDDGMTRIPDDGTMLPEWETLPDVDEGEM